MNIVLIEDDLQKAERVTETLRTVNPTCKVALFQSYQSGLKRIRSDEHIDLIILDMSLPTFDPGPNSRSGRPRPLGGYDLMRKLVRYNQTAPVVVLTALENFGSIAQPVTLVDLEKRCREEFSTFFVGTVYYSQSKSAWKGELELIVRGISE